MRKLKLQDANECLGEADFIGRKEELQWMKMN